MRFLQGTHESVYEYDGESHRVRIKELESSVETKNETFVWCEERLCQKRSGSTVVRNFFEQGFEEGSSDYVYTRDHQGSVREVVGSNGTTVSGRVVYDPWGRSTETGSVLSDFGFTGHHLDRPTGLNLALFRGYDPQLGRWLSEDPIGLKGGSNLYAYVANDVPNHTDSTGLAIDPECMQKIRMGCRQGCWGMFSSACYVVCVADAVTLETISPGTMCENKPSKRNRCLARCAPLLFSGSQDLQCSPYHKCVADCMAEP